MSDHDPLAPIEALADDWVRSYPSLVIGPQLRAALAEARQAVGEVTVTEEWAPQRRGRDVHPADVRHDRGGAAEWCFPGSEMTLVRRTVVTTRRVGEWEVAE